ncbi:Pentatricopeptide repeat-containing protein [Escovopsis weberi]|uniref:Pentatricopeptide repeat-containing protein n=1 Tax=Escovopsis weberi TaxID=150374 RepID=A0A0M8MR19_ESCWE|nr:Pentatricopeptide repeat-containing protein [Escovopsis weberi]
MNASRTTCWRCASQLCSAQARGPGSGAALFSSLGSTAAATAAASQPESAIDIFNDVVNRAPEVPPSSLAEQEIVLKLKALAEKSSDPLEKMEILETEILPSLNGQGHNLPTNINTAISKFLDQTCDAMTRSGGAEGSLKLSELGTKLDNFDLSWRNRLILNLCHKLVRRVSSRGDTKLHLTELINLWQCISHMKRMSARKHASTYWFTLPTADDILRDVGTRYQANAPPDTQSSPMLRALTSIFLQFTPQEAQAVIPGLLVTLAVILDPQISTQGAQNLAAPLLDRAATVLRQGTLDDAFFSVALNGEHIQFPESRLRELEAYVTKQWPSAMSLLHQKDALWREKLVTASGSGPGAVNSVERVLSLLRQAFAKAKQTSPAILSLWNDVKASAEENQAFAKEMQHSPDFLDEWIFVLCAIRGGTKVQEALDLMQRVHLRPTMRTYTNMMHGWKICKEIDKIEALWAKLVKSGIKLDAFIWTERISSLIEAEPQAGIQALAEMQALWKAAVARNAPHMAVQPSIEVVNAAFKGLITLDRKAAFDVIEWAGREQIKPNVRTYNILIQQSFRNDPPDDIQGILKAMEQQGIQPDEATFTILLEEVLGGISGEAAPKQVAAVQGAFEQMAAAGFRPNPMTYAKMLYAVTDFASGGADEAIAAVLGHMRENRVAITPEIVTILIERAIRTDPKDLDAVRRILQEHGFARIGHGDQTLWERVMSAHAVAGDTAGALAIFDDLALLDRPVTSLPCLRNLLGALIASARMDDASRVVQTVLQHKIKKIEGPGDTRYWKHAFWFMAREHALFRLDDVPLQVRSWMEQRGSARMLG